MKVGHVAPRPPRGKLAGLIRKALRPATMLAHGHDIRLDARPASGGLIFAQAFRRSLHPGENLARLQLRYFREDWWEVDGPIRQLRERSRSD